VRDIGDGIRILNPAPPDVRVTYRRLVGARQAVLPTIGVMEIRQAVEAARCVSGQSELGVIHQSEDHVVFDAGHAIVKCGTRDEFGIEAWACERARSLGVPAPEVVSIDTTAPIPHLALAKVPGVALVTADLPPGAAERAARHAGAMLRMLHGDVMPGFGWIDRHHFRSTREIRGKSPSWIGEIGAALELALDGLVAAGAVTDADATKLRAEMTALRPAVEAVTEGRFLHGDLGRMHIMVDPDTGQVTGLIDWGDVQVGDPAWDLAISACHFASASEGLLRVYHARQPDLFPHFLEGYEPPAETAERIEILGAFYLAYRHAWVARLGPGTDGTPSPSLAMLHEQLSRTTHRRGHPNSGKPRHVSPETA
jgi:aminoglycoside phosphotransferase (APT) family kinase protein